MVFTRMLSLFTAVFLTISPGTKNSPPAAVEAVRFSSEPAKPPPTGYVSAIDALHAWVGLVYTADGGATWVAWIPPNTAASRFLDAPPYGQTTFFATAERGWLTGVDSAWTTDDSGATWQPQVPGHIHAMAFVGRTGYLAAGDDRFVRNYTTADSGRTWRECGAAWELSKVAPWSSVSFVNPRDGWITIANYDQLERPLTGGVARTADGGCTWKVLWRDTRGKEENLTELQFVDEDFGWLTATYGSLRETTDGGVHWKRVALPKGFLMLESTYLASRTSGWIAGATVHGSAVYHTANGGKHWSKVPESDVRHGFGVPPAWGYAFLLKLDLRR